MIRYNTVKTAGKSLTPPPVDYGKAFNKGLAQSGLFEYLEKQALRKEEIKKENEIKDAQIAQAVGNLREGATVSKMSNFMRAKSGEFVMSKKNELAAIKSQMLNMKNKNSQEYFDLQNQEQKIKSAVANFNDGLERNRQARTLTLKALNPDDNTDDGADISNTLNNRFSKDYYMMFETEEGQKYLEENFTIDNNTGEWYIAGMEYKGKPISGSNLPTTDLKSYTKEKALDDAFSKYITRVGKGTSINSGFTNDYKTTVNNILSGMTMEELQSQLVDDFENEGGTPRYFGIEEVQAAKEEIDKGGVPPSVFEIEVNGEMKSFNAWEIYSNKNNAKMFLNNRRNKDAEIAMKKQIDANQKVSDEIKKGNEKENPYSNIQGEISTIVNSNNLDQYLLAAEDEFHPPIWEVNLGPGSGKSSGNYRLVWDSKEKEFQVQKGQGSSAGDYVWVIQDSLPFPDTNKFYKEDRQELLNFLEKEIGWIQNRQRSNIEVDEQFDSKPFFSPLASNTIPVVPYGQNVKKFDPNEGAKNTNTNFIPTGEDAAKLGKNLRETIGKIF